MGGSFVRENKNQASSVIIQFSPTKGIGVLHQSVALTHSPAVHTTRPYYYPLYPILSEGVLTCYAFITAAKFTMHPEDHIGISYAKKLRRDKGKKGFIGILLPLRPAKRLIPVPEIYKQKILCYSVRIMWCCFHNSYSYFEGWAISRSILIQSKDERRWVKFVKY